MITTDKEVSPDISKKLPPGWRSVRLREVCEIVGDSINPLNYIDEVFAHYSIPAFDDKQTPIFEVGARILSNKILFPKGTVLFSKLNPRISRAWYVSDNHSYRCLCSTEFLPINPKVSQIDPRYLTLILQEPRLITYLRRQVAAATKSRERLKPEQVMDVTIPLPPLREQQRISTILGEQMAAVERAREAAAIQLETAKMLPAAYLRNVFESSEAQMWPVKHIGEIAKVQSGYAFKSDWFNSDGIRLLRNVNILQGHISWNDKVYLPLNRRTEFNLYELSVGDIVLSLDRPVVSNGLKVARLTSDDVPSLLLQRVGRFRLREGVDPDYLYAFLNSATFISAITVHDQSLGVPHVSPGQVEAVEIPFPPIAEQQHIAALLNEQIAKVERIRTLLEEQIDAINKLPALLLRKAFDGEL